MDLHNTRTSADPSSQERQNLIPLHMTGILATPNENRPALGIMLVLIAYVAFSTIDTSAKWLVLSGIPVMQVVFMRYAGHFLISCGIMLKGGFRLSCRGSEQ